MYLEQNFFCTFS